MVSPEQQKLLAARAQPAETIRARDERLQHPQPILPHAKPLIASVEQGGDGSARGGWNLLRAAMRRKSFRVLSIHRDITTTAWDTQGQPRFAAERKQS